MRYMQRKLSRVLDRECCLSLSGPVVCCSFHCASRIATTCVPDLLASKSLCERWLVFSTIFPIYYDYQLSKAGRKFVEKF